MTSKKIKWSFITRSLPLFVSLTIYCSFSFAAVLDSLAPTLRPLRVGVYSGSFDPPHLGHYQLMQVALAQGLDYILMIPNGRMAHKPNASAFSDRLAMSQIMASESSRILVPTHPKLLAEIIEGSIEATARLAPNAVFVGVIGSDVADLMSGRTPGYIAEQNAAWTDKIHEWFVGARVRDYVAPTSILGRPVTRAFMDDTKNPSSTEIRRSFIHNKAQLAQAVGSPVANWITKNLMYQQINECRAVFR